MAHARRSRRWPMPRPVSAPGCVGFSPERTRTRLLWRLPPSSRGLLALLKDLSAGVSERIRYESREDEGTQSPAETLDRGWGSCRDLAVLFVEAARSLGFGARIVSGYLYNPDQDRVASGGVGSTHAWAEVYVPGAGWITFDPTNRTVGGFNLIPVAVARDIRQAMPVAGSFVGMTGAFQGMWVEVRVSDTGEAPGGRWPERRGLVG